MYLFISFSLLQGFSHFVRRYFVKYILLFFFLFVISCPIFYPFLYLFPVDQQTRVSIDLQPYAVEYNTRYLQEGLVNDFKRIYSGE